MGERLPCKQEVTSSNLVFSILVTMRPGVTPVPIPNTMVKTRAAESTALETMWEDRWLPVFRLNSDWNLGACAKISMTA